MDDIKKIAYLITEDPDTVRMPDFFLSDVDKPADPNAQCQEEGCQEIATTAIEIEFARGGRLWNYYCDEHAQQEFNMLDAMSKEHDRGIEREQGYCPECGYRKTNHAESCPYRPSDWRSFYPNG